LPDLRVRLEEWGRPGPAPWFETHRSATELAEATVPVLRCDAPHHEDRMSAAVLVPRWTVH